MAGNGAIQILRGTSEQIDNNKTQTLLPGQLLYNTDKNYLTCGGGGSSKAVNSAPVACRELVVYSGDTNDAVGASTEKVASITNSGTILTYKSINGHMFTVNDSSPLLIAETSVQLTAGSSQLSISNISGSSNITMQGPVNIGGYLTANSGITSNGNLSIGAMYQLAVGNIAGSGGSSLLPINVSAPIKMTTGSSAAGLQITDGVQSIAATPGYLMVNGTSITCSWPTKSGTLATTSDIPKMYLKSVLVQSGSTKFGFSYISGTSNVYTSGADLISDMSGRILCNGSRYETSSIQPIIYCVPVAPTSLQIFYQAGSGALSNAYITLSTGTFEMWKTDLF